MTSEENWDIINGRWVYISNILNGIRESDMQSLQCIYTQCRKVLFWNRMTSLIWYGRLYQCKSTRREKERRWTGRWHLGHRNKMIIKTETTHYLDSKRSCKSQWKWPQFCFGFFAVFLPSLALTPTHNDGDDTTAVVSTWRRSSCGVGYRFSKLGSRRLEFVSTVQGR